MRRITLTQYLVEQQREKGVVSAELRLLIEVVARACKSISNAVSKGALTGIKVDRRDPPARDGERDRDMHRRGRFPGAALLVGERDQMGFRQTSFPSPFRA